MSQVFPTMRGNAVVAVGAGEFEVPLFSHVIDGLWQGCSPAEFPDEQSMSQLLDKMLGYHTTQEKVNCRWLWESGDESTGYEVWPRFDAILNLYQWGKYAVPDGTEQLTVEMYDSLDEISDQVEELADWVIERLDQGKKVLVHCQAGLNRSSLIVARILMKKYGLSAQDAISKIREQRSPTCLCNSAFVDYLMQIEKGE